MMSRSDVVRRSALHAVVLVAALLAAPIALASLPRVGADELVTPASHLELGDRVEDLALVLPDLAPGDRFVPRDPLPPAAASAPEKTHQGVGVIRAALRWEWRRRNALNALGMRASGGETRIGSEINARYYAPESGRFISKDGFDYGDTSNPPSLHLYYYAMANPLVYTDPTGHAPEGGVRTREQARQESLARTEEQLRLMNLGERLERANSAETGGARASVQVESGPQVTRGDLIRQRRALQQEAKIDEHRKKLDSLNPNKNQGEVAAGMALGMVAGPGLGVLSTLSMAVPGDPMGGTSAISDLMVDPKRTADEMVKPFNLAFMGGAAATAGLQGEMVGPAASNALTKAVPAITDALSTAREALPFTVNLTEQSTRMSAWMRDPERGALDPGIAIRWKDRASKTLSEWLKDKPDLLQEAKTQFETAPEWQGIDPQKAPVSYVPKDVVDALRAQPGESGGHHPHGLALGGELGQKLTPTGETRTVKSPEHSAATALQRRIIRAIKEQLGQGGEK